MFYRAMLNICSFYAVFACITVFNLNCEGNNEYHVTKQTNKVGLTNIWFLNAWTALTNGRPNCLRFNQSQGKRDNLQYSIRYQLIEYCRKIRICQDTISWLVVWSGTVRIHYHDLFYGQKTLSWLGFWSGYIMIICCLIRNCQDTSSWLVVQLSCRHYAITVTIILFRYKVV